MSVLTADPAAAHSVAADAVSGSVRQTANWVPPRSMPGAGSQLPLRAARRAWPYRTILRYGVRPFFVGLDLAAWVIVLAVFGTSNAGAASALVTLLAFSSGGFYKSKLSLSILGDLWQLWTRAAVVGAAVSALAVVVGDPAHPKTDLIHGLRNGVIAGALVVCLRAVGYGTVRWARRRGLVGHTTLVLGAGRIGADLVRQMQEHGEYGLHAVGFLDSQPLLSPEERPVPVLGDDTALAQTIVEFGVRNVIVAFGRMPESALVEVIRTCDRLDVEIFLVPRLFELYVADREVEIFWGLPLVRLPKPAFLRPTWLVKRAFDLFASILGLAVISPLMALIALGVRLEGGPGVLFRQERVGLDGRPFEVLKFRSMKPATEHEGATNWNIAQDNRLGRFGKFLRSTSLDELPQLWNVVRGDMSLVGPRPERPYFVDQFAQLYPRYGARHRVPAGVTGWAQIHGLRGDTSIVERARFDNFYIENWSLWMDIRICLLTVLSVLRRAGG